jgi:hypothetical protein
MEENAHGFIFLPEFAANGIWVQLKCAIFTGICALLELNMYPSSHIKRKFIG